MIIGIPKEIKNHEYRVGATPAMVKSLTDAGHTVWIQGDAGKAIGYSDEHYQKAGAMIKAVKEVWQAELILKVKEPQEEEFPFMRKGQILFCYLHLAPNLQLTKQLIKAEVIALAFDTVTDSEGRLPLLIPMSAIAGRMSIQVGAWALQLNQGGKGILLGSVAGVPAGRVTILGGGVSGTEAAKVALGMGADVTVLERNPKRLDELNQLLPGVKTCLSTPEALEELLPKSDLVIGAVLIPGKSAPKLIMHHHIKKMEPGSVLVDISIDQGGCAETSRPTTHEHPIYKVEGIIHYCVTNMPGACALTATEALGRATLPYVLKIASHGWKEALRLHPALLHGLNVCLGYVTNVEVADDLDFEYVSPSSFLGNHSA